MDTKEIVALTEKWLEHLRQITVNYEKAIGTLEKARQDYVTQTTKWYHHVFPYIIPLVSIIIILIAFGIILHVAGCPNPVDIKFQGLELTQHCTASQ